MTSYEIVVVVISLLSALFSAFSFYKTRKWATAAKENDMARELYDKFLLSKLPIEFDKIILSSDWKIAGAEFSSMIKEFKRNIRYFKYTHTDIYKKVTDAIDSIEGIIVEAANRPPEDSSERNKVEDALKTEIDKIYNAFINELPADKMGKYLKKTM